MPSLIRLLPLEEDERRRRPRYLVPPEEPLVVGVAVVGGGRLRTLTGRVRDISEAGLSILLPDDEACGEMAERGRTVVVVLTLPSGTITMRAEVAHCAAPGARGEGGGYLFGVSITEIDAEDYDRLAGYIGGPG
ncbi:MAG TPA: PilZ domain-containing protein [Pyrinomonadaceae bacterium]